MARKSRLSGLVSAISNRDGTFTFWTRDNGRHWYLANWRVIAPPVVGRGNALYTWGGAVVSRVWPWPPRGSPRCSRWNTEPVIKICEAEFDHRPRSAVAGGHSEVGAGPARSRNTATHRAAACS
jgi:hypothetical protein